MLHKLRTNAPLKILSLLIAVVLWFVVLGSRTVEITKELNLEIITPQDLVISNDIPDKIAFRLSGPKAFLRNILNRKDAPIRVNLSNAKPGLVTYRFFGDNIQVPIGVKVLLVNPSSIAIKLETVRTKEIPVKLATIGAVAPGYKINSLRLSKNTVKIKGPESKLITIPEIETLPVDLSKLTASGETEVALDFSRYPGISIDNDPPKIQFDVYHDAAQYKIKSVKVKVLSSRKFEVKPSELSIYVNCTIEDLRRLAKSHIYAIVDLRDKGPGVYEPALKVDLPQTVQLIKILPQKVKVTLF